ncbi:putative 1-phosphatidylinositol-3-phosphate 5-kinase FAB1D isoform X1 [Carex littledalei]|uniref:1-phosphatidylinositol-3-phosphate 5-kinase n=1 Tax=Carex littledalei TaxID=544730 RepID=A0A833RIZ8_9POAL|nr:putative 1-phosphatidylinositol-3-phosphate 5-kinase FAB1D isoform X1 [Carex littledalei]
MNPPVRDEEPHDLAIRNSLHYENGTNGTEHIRIGEEPGGFSGRISPPIISNISINPSILVPPDPAVREEEKGISLTSMNLEEDEDDFGGEIGTKWEDESPSPSPTSNSNPISDGERQVAMKEAMNGQFKLLVRRFLEVEGIPLISNEGDSWLDVVANISWEAAELIRPEPSEGKEMDPWSYVKVKCVASGTPNQSVVIKGLAFKKNTAHKHMLSSFKNPKLLLLKGVLGHSDSGLSSFNALGEENDHLQKSIMQMIEICQPNVILVEKTVSRDIQELLLKKGVSLGLDMKLNRLERISRCTGSTVISFSDVFKDPKLKSCESFHIEKFVEEHNSVGEGGKKPAKTLMFLEGFPRPLGCTILLRGANSEELKKVKHMLQYTVFAAYHLILETSFFEDQRVFLNDKIAPKVEPSAVPYLPSLSNGHTQYNPKPSQNAKELPLLPGFYRVNGSSNMDLYDISADSAAEFSTQERTTDTDKEGSVASADYGGHDSGSCVNKGKMDGNDSETILVLTTSQCITKQSMCEQSRYNRIKYYGNSDISLGRYLKNLLYSQKYSCSTCGEPQEAHEYSYTHRNGNLTVIVRHLHPDHHLSGENEGKIWMWSLCLKCESETGISTATPRVVMSTSACSLSFGKFLELSFSSQSAARRLSKCGHLLHRDCLRFFGLGSKVAMFWYTPVEVFSAFKPPSILEFNNPNRRGWLKDEYRKKVFPRGSQLFSKIATILQHLKSKQEYYISASAKELPGVEEMFHREKADFESLLESIEKSEKNEDTAANELLSLNLVYQDLVLQTYVWDRRLHHLLQYKPSNEEQEHTEKNGEEATNKLESLEVSSQAIPNAGKAQLETTDMTQDSLVPEPRESLIENSTQGDTEKWVWTPFAELKSTYHSEISNFYRTRFNMLNKYTPVHLLLSPLNGERDPIRFSVGPDGSILLVCEDEISSIISRALVVSEIKHNNKFTHEPPLEKSESHLSVSSWASSNKWSSTDSADLLDSLGSQYSLSVDEAVPLSKDQHPEVIVNGGLGLKGKYIVVCVCAEEFYNLRKKCCPSEMAYIISLSRCEKWDAQGGKSKAFFAKTKDDRFIIKQIKRAEFESFLKIEKEYFKYVNESIDSGNPTGLAKILGIYEVRQIKNGKETKMDLMVMENLLFGKNISRTYDLKGAIYSRHISSSDSSKDLNPVFLDQNFIEDLRVSPFYVGVKTKHLLQRAIWNDTTFLTSINVMDYSLLVGVDKHRHELVFGIIDYLRQYTWDKQLETWVKSSLVVPKNISPTVISPKEYKKRFRKFMIKYFFTVPDDWITHPSFEECVGPCKFCSQKDSKETKISDRKLLPDLESSSSL